MEEGHSDDMDCLAELLVEAMLRDPAAMWPLIREIIISGENETTDIGRGILSTALLSQQCFVSTLRGHTFSQTITTMDVME